ncbi:hypothetical protein HYZ78_00545 [Candidatus Microgenomates bacterium]|nr:hypothetical protein [Candidatus Microgenomates bacterium]
MTSQPRLTPEELKIIQQDRKIRRSLARDSHYWFFSLYLSHYLTYQFAPLHFEMFKATEDSQMQFVTLVAFRGSGKSTILTLSCPIWAITGALQKKFVLIISQTQNQARLHLESIKRELENNDLLKADVGPFDQPRDEWAANSIVIPKFDARITAASTEQSIRGIRHGQYRPDLIICDDIEDLNSVKTREGRDRTHSWFNGEIVPVGDKNTKLLVIGNLLHEDCLIMRFKNLIIAGKLRGSFFAFPLLDKDGQIAWPAKYPTIEDVEKLKVSFSQESAFYREYLLRIISDEDRVVHPEWIQHYDYGEIPKSNVDNFREILTGIDLAISEKDSADFTAMVSATVIGYEEDLKIYIHPYPINKRMGFPETVETATALSKSLGNGYYTRLLIEEVGYQGSLIQYLISKNIPAEGFKVSGQDKRARLALITHLVKQGKVLFPKKGAEELIEQLTGFGIEKHDDLADAFSLLLLKILKEDNKAQIDFFWV